MDTTSKKLNLPIPEGSKSEKNWSIALSVQIDSHSSSKGLNGKDTLKRLKKALEDGIFSDLSNNLENGETKQRTK